MERMKIVYNNALKSINAHKFKFLLFILSFAFALIFTICANCTTLVNGKYYGETETTRYIIEINGNSFFMIEQHKDSETSKLGLYHSIPENTSFNNFYTGGDGLLVFVSLSNATNKTEIGHRINAFSFSLRYSANWEWQELTMVCRWAVAVQIISGIIMFFDFTCAIIFFIKAYKSSKLKKD